MTFDRSDSGWPCVLLCLLVGGCAMIDRLSGEGLTRHLCEHGVAATALVLAIRDTGITVNDDPVVDFDLEVRPELGPAYPAQTRGRVSRLHIPRIQPGTVLPVRIDPDDRDRVALAVCRT